MLVEVLDGLELGPIFFPFFFLSADGDTFSSHDFPVPLPRVARKHGNEMGMTPLLGMSGEDSGHRSDGKPTR